MLQEIMVEGVFVEWFLRISFFLFGAIIGSFLNVCIVRLPQEKSIVFPGSHCGQCQKPVRWFDNIPILSYFILGGKCRDCGAKFSIRYAFIEFLTGCFFVGFYLYFGLDILLLPYLVLVSALIVATFVDFEFRIIPDQLSFYGVPFACAVSFLLPRLQLERGMPSLDIGWMLAGGITFLCLLLMQIDAWRRHAKLHKDDLHLVIVVMALLLLQQVCLFFGALPAGWGARLVSLAASLQGMIIGAGALYLLGLVGALIIQKRVVTTIDLKVVSERPEALFQELIKQGYLDDAGEIQKKFALLKSVEEFTLPVDWDKERPKIYEMIVSCFESGVMGGGDVKLMALIGAFLGWKLALITVVVAPFFGAPVGIIEKIRTKSSAIAFGPYLAMAAVVCLLWGERIAGWYFTSFGF